MILTPLLLFAAASPLSDSGASPGADPAKRATELAGTERAGKASAEAEPDDPKESRITLSATPPSSVLIPAVPRARIGNSVDAVTPMIQAHRQFATPLISETPAHTVRVDEFHLMVSEVTNEQFLVFVEATGNRPSLSWAQPALANAQRAFNEEQGLRIRAALDAGQRPPERQEFQQATWWERNWRDAEWAMPAEIAALPVVWVDFQDAREYAEWAGMRLMTEQEFQAAGRGERDQRFVWGDEWVGANAVTSIERAQRGPSPVGSRRGGATPHGVHDLLGNVWEWTSSPFVAYPGYRDTTVRWGDRRNPVTLEPRPTWNPDQRVMVGGSWQQQDYLPVRLTTRRGAERSQKTNANGFRTAASTRPGLDRAQALLRQVPASRLGDGTLAPDRVLAVDRWRVGPGEVKLEGYAVIHGYETVSLVPLDQLAFNNPNLLVNHTLREGPVPFAVLHTSLATAQPALEPGTYILAYRGAGRSRTRGENGDDDGPESATPSAVDALVDTSGPSIVAIRTDGSLAAGWRTTEVRFENPDRQQPMGRIGVLVADDEEEEGAIDGVRVVLPVPARAGQRAFHFEIALDFAPGTLAGPWRR